MYTLVRTKTMDKKRLKVFLVVLDAVKSTFIDDALKE